MSYNPKSHMGLKKPKEQVEYTHEDIQQAIISFQNAGGLIRKLPDQVTSINLQVSQNFRARHNHYSIDESAGYADY